MRNAIYHSRSNGNGSRDLWNGNPILWNQIAAAKVLAHINLTSYSSMTVSLATHVLSSKMESAMYRYYPRKLPKSTGNLCQHMDCFLIVLTSDLRRKEN